MIDLKRYMDLTSRVNTFALTGMVTQVVGLTIGAKLPSVEVGEVCRLYNLKGTDFVLSEVVGFKDENVLLMPLGDIKGIGPGSKVIPEGQTLQVPVGYELLGRVLDSLCQPIDGLDFPICTDMISIENPPPNPLSRKRITEQLSLGVKSIDGFTTVGVGQRIGIFAGSGVGKSTLLGMIARNSDADVNVIALIGERGREVREFIERDLGEEGLKRSVVIVATSDQPALLRLKGALAATAIAEFFRDKGANTLLMMDSLTRFAMANREVGLATGEPPVSRGYTPSVFSALPKLLERSGNSNTGSITGLYTVLVDGDDMNEPIADAVRGILDGHIILSRDLADKNHFPAVDVLKSISRLMTEITDKQHLDAAGYIRNLMAVYRQAQDLIEIGAYKPGSNPKIDEAIDKIESINNMLKQGIFDHASMNDTIKSMIDLANLS